MEICVSTYSFSQLIDKGELNQLGTIKASKDLGFNAVEVCDINPHDNSSKREYAAKIKEEADSLGVKLVNFVFGADLLNGSGDRKGNIDAEMSYLKEMVDIAEILGVNHLRHDVLYKLGEFRSFDTALPIIASRVREISEYAKSKGIRTSVENHGLICQSPDRMERLFKAVDCDNFGTICDMGNFLCCDCDIIQAVSTVAPFATFVHAKDMYLKSGNCIDAPGEGFFNTRGMNYLQGVVIGHGIVPVTQCLKILKNAGYDGYVTIEYEGFMNCLDGIRIGKSNLEKYIANANLK